MTIAVIIGIITVVHLIGYLLLIYWATHLKPSDNAKEGEIIDHAWDGNLREINNPMPGWWLSLFYILIGFSFVYFALYPGVFKGVLSWTQVSQYEEQSRDVDQRSQDYFQAYAQKSVEELAKNPEALDTGRRIFLQNCAVCHATDGGGLAGHYPNLTDKVWNWGGKAEDIVKTITDGRNPIMTPGGALIANPHNMTAEDKSNLSAVATYVASMSGHSGDAAQIEAGKALYNRSCIACHGPEGKGMAILGAPDLTDDVWQYAESGLSTSELKAFLEQQILNPPNNKMPAWKNVLSPERIKVVSAYVYSLSNP